MKSPMLLMFVLPLICCSDIYDGAGNDGNANIKEQRVIMARQLNELKTLYAEDADNKKIQETRNHLQHTLYEIKRSTELKIQEVAQRKQLVENNPCLLEANRSLIYVTDDKMWIFDKDIRELKPEVFNNIEITIDGGTNLIEQYDKFLLENGDTKLGEVFSQQFGNFNEIYNDMKIAINHKEPVDHSKIEEEATMLIEHLRKEARRIISKVKKCINSLQRN